MDALCLAIDANNVNRVCQNQGSLLLEPEGTHVVSETLEALTYGIDGFDARIYAAPTSESFKHVRFRLLRPQILAYDGPNLLVTRTDYDGWMLGLHGYATLADHRPASQTSHGIPSTLNAAVVRTLVECGDLGALTSRALALYAPSGDWHSVRPIYTTRTDRLRTLPPGSQWLPLPTLKGVRHLFDRGSKLLLDALHERSIRLWGSDLPDAPDPQDTHATG